MILEDRGYIDFPNNGELNVCFNDLFFDRYLIQTEEDIPEDIVDYKDGMFVYTKKISARQLEKITKNAMFYAKIED